MANATRYVNTASTAGGDGTTNNTTGADRAFATLSEAEAALPANITTGGSQGIWTILCEGSAADTTAVTFSGTTTSSSYYIIVKTDTGKRPLGYRDTSKYHLDVTASNGINIVEDRYIRFEGIAVQLTDTTGNRKGAFTISDIQSDNNDIRFGYCIASGVISGGYGDDWGYHVTDGYNHANVTWYNCIAFNFYNTSYPINMAAGGFLGSYNKTLTAHNCTVYNCNSGFYVRTEFTFTTNNCLSYCDEVHSEWIDFDGPGTYAGNYNASTDATATGANSLTNQANTDIDFVSTTSTNADFLAIDSTSTCVGAGTNNPGSGLYSDDIRGATRTSPWDIGSDEYVSSGTTGTGALTLPAQTLAGTGLGSASGTGAITLAAQSLAGTGIGSATGTGALSLPAQTLAGVGNWGANGTGALTLPATTLAGTGTVSAVGTGAISLPAQTLAGTGTDTFTGAGAISLSKTTLAATGTFVPNASGTGSLILPVPVLAATGAEIFTGTSAITMIPMELGGSGTFSQQTTGDGALSLPVFTLFGYEKNVNIALWKNALKLLKFNMMR